MKKLVFGSLNIDRTYQVAGFVRPKETISALGYSCFCGGKGFNQAVALARAGSRLYFAGVIGADGGMLRQGLLDEHIDIRLLKESEGANGHAVIQVNEQGENCIIVVPGSNAEVSRDYVDTVLAEFSQGDLIVLQNEIPHLDYIIEQAGEKGMVIALNPSPFNEAVMKCRLDRVRYLLINEVEGGELTGRQAPQEILDAIHGRLPGTAVVLTLGKDGAYFMAADGQRLHCPAAPCQCVDTTAAGDTFTGYFLTEYLEHADAAEALSRAAAASAIAVSRKGASNSIPRREEVLRAVGARA